VWEGREERGDDDDDDVLSLGVFVDGERGEGARDDDDDDDARVEEKDGTSGGRGRNDGRRRG